MRQAHDIESRLSFIQYKVCLCAVIVLETIFNRTHELLNIKCSTKVLVIDQMSYYQIIMCCDLNLKY